MKRNTASQVIGVQMITAADGTAFTGSVTAYVTGDGGTQAAGSVGSGACTHEGNGFHTYAPAQAETDYSHVAFTFIGSGAIPATVQVYPTFPQTGDAFARLGAPAGASVSADVAAVKTQTAAIEVDTADIQSRIPAALVSGRIDASVGAVAADAITAAALAADAGTEIGTAVWASATRVLTAGTNIALAKGTGVTGFNDLSAAEVNAEVDTAISDAALATAANLATVAGYLDTEIAAILADTNELQTDWADGGRLDLILDARASQASVDTIDGIVDDILVDTAVIGAAGAGLTAIPWNASWDAEVQSGAADALTAYGAATATDVTTAAANVSVDEIQATALADLFNTDSGTTYASAVVGSVVKEIADNAGGSALTAAGIADAVWDEAIAGHATSGSTGEALAAAGGAGDPWITALPGAYSAGQAGKIVGDYLNASVSSRATQTSVDDLPTNAELATALDPLPTAAENATAVWAAGTRSLTVLDEDSTTLDLDATIRAAVGMASANLDTQIGDLPTNAELATSQAAADDATLAAIAALSIPTAAAVADAVWDEAIAGHATAGSTGAALSAAGAAGDPWSTALPGAYGAGTAGQILGDYLDAAVSDVPTATENADALLNRDMSAVSDTNARSPLNALRFIRNKWDVASGTLTVKKEDDSTTAWTSTVSATAGADPVTGNDPA